MSYTLPKTALSPARATLITAFCLLSVMAQACHSATGSSDQARVIAIATIPGAPGYANIVRGVQLAVDRLNAQGGVSFSVGLPPDSITSPVRLAEYIRANPAVIAVVGHPESGNSLETIPIYADASNNGANGVVLISQTASSPQLRGVSPWFFRVAPSDNEAARFTARWVADSLLARRAAIIYRNDPYGRDWANAFSETFTQAGGSVGLRNPYLTGVTEWDAQALTLGHDKPDVVLFPGDAEDALSLLRAMKKHNVETTFVGGDGTEGIAGDSAAQGAHVAAFFRADQVSGAEAQHFLDTYRSRFHEEPDGFAALSYDAALVVGRTILAGADSRASLRLALERIGNGSPSVDGVVGRIAFDSLHDIKGRKVFLSQVKEP